MLYIDVSHYDWDRFGGNLNWKQIKASGIDVVFIRASYGDPKIYNPETRHFTEMASAAKEAGLKVGGYHNLINGDFASIQRQVAYFKSELDAANADYAMVDIEPYEALKQNNLWPRLSTAELFAQEYRLQDGYRKLAIYLPQYVWSGYMDKADLQVLMEHARGPLINANYPLNTINGPYDQLYKQANGDNGVGWKSYGNVAPEVWQYSSKAIVPGASTLTDVNAFKGTAEEFDTRMAWVLTRNLQAFRDQMNEFFPIRKKTSDGTIGDAIHQTEHSGHNPDDTEYNNAEWDNDSDTKSEVRAIDIDSDTGDPNVSMEDILQHLLKLAKSDNNFPIRYMIYNRRIYRNSNGWVKETYEGTSTHTEHIHLSGEYSNTADENYYNYRLDELVALTDAEKDELVTRTASAVWNYMLERPDSTTTPKQKSSAATYQRYNDVVNDNSANKVINTFAPVLSAIASKVDIDQSEIDAIAAASAEAVVSALGTGPDITGLVETLRNSLTPDQIAALKAAL